MKNLNTSLLFHLLYLKERQENKLTVSETDDTKTYIPFSRWYADKLDFTKKSTRKAYKAKTAIQQWISENLSKQEILDNIVNELGLTDKSAMIYYYRYK